MWRKCIILLLTLAAAAQDADAQKVALKNNLMMDGMASPNIAAEFKLGARTTLEIPASLNLWTFGDHKKFKHVAVQPELRWWLCAPFTGHFFGVHAHYASYNVGGFGPFEIIKNNRYEGWLVGGGVSYGYSWILAPRWSLEAEAGVGYAYLDHDKFPCGKCEPSAGHKTKHYFGPTRLALSLVFMIK